LKKLSGIEEIAAGLLLAAVTLLIVIQLVLASAAPRHASPLTPVVMGLFFWATMLGVPAATRRGAHLSVSLLGRLLPPRGQRVLAALVMLATLAFFAVLAVVGVRLCRDQAHWGNRFMGTALPDWAVAASIPLAAALSAWRAVEAWWTMRRGEPQDREG
jgi:C4-dicarboxylate transporter DctQ subunit